MGFPPRCTPHSLELFVNEKKDTDFQELFSALPTPEGAKMYMFHSILIEQQANYITQPAFKAFYYMRYFMGTNKVQLCTSFSGNKINRVLNREEPCLYL